MAVFSITVLVCNWKVASASERFDDCIECVLLIRCSHSVSVIWNTAKWLNSLCVLKYFPRKWNNLLRFQYLLTVICLFQGTEIDILETVQNLLRHCSNPTSFLKPLAKLFSVIRNKLSRHKLCLVFQVLHFYVSFCAFFTCSNSSRTKWIAVFNFSVHELKNLFNLHHLLSESNRIVYDRN